MTLDRFRELLLVGRAVIIHKQKDLIKRLHDKLHHLFAQIDSGEPYGSYAPEEITCEFCTEVKY